MVNVIKTQKLGLEVWVVIVNRLAVASFMSEAGAVTYCKQKGLL
jgi:hypothetical protein